MRQLKKKCFECQAPVEVSLFCDGCGIGPLCEGCLKYCCFERNTQRYADLVNGKLSNVDVNCYDCIECGVSADNPGRNVDQFVFGQIVHYHNGNTLRHAHVCEDLGDKWGILTPFSAKAVNKEKLFIIE